MICSERPSCIWIQLECIWHELQVITGNWLRLKYIWSGHSWLYTTCQFITLKFYSNNPLNRLKSKTSKVHTATTFIKYLTLLQLVGIGKCNCFWWVCSMHTTKLMRFAISVVRQVCVLLLHCVQYLCTWPFTNVTWATGSQSILSAFTPAFRVYTCAVIIQDSFQAWKEPQIHIANQHTRKNSITFNLNLL